MKLPAVPRWVWIVVAIVVAVILLCCGIGIGAASQAATEPQESPSVTRTQQHTTPPVATHTPEPTRTVEPVKTSTDPCVERDRCVSPQNLDAEWPLTVSWANIDCMWWYQPGHERQKMVWVVAPDGTAYAVNGTAQAHLQMSKIDSIWADSTTISGTKVNITPLTNVGLLLCK